MDPIIANNTQSVDTGYSVDPSSSENPNVSESTPESLNESTDTSSRSPIPSSEGVSQSRSSYCFVPTLTGGFDIRLNKNGLIAFNSGISVFIFSNCSVDSEKVEIKSLKDSQWFAVTPAFYLQTSSVDSGIDPGGGAVVRTEVGILSGYASVRVDVGISRSDSSSRWNGHTAGYLGAFFGIVNGGVAVDCSDLFTNHAACQVMPAISIDLLRLGQASAFSHFYSLM